MQRLLKAGLILALPCLLLSSPLKAQERTPWALEASIIMNHQSYDFSDVQRSVDSRIAHERETYPDRTISNPRSIDAEWEPDLKLGFRFQNFHAGFTYTLLREQTVGYTSYVEGFNGAHYQEWEYTVTSQSREYLASIGYTLPLHRLVSLGVFGSYGWAVASGTIVDHYGPPGTSDQEADLSGKYNPWRIEGRLRITITRYIDLDIGYGWRHSVLDEMKADYGLELGDYPVTTYDGEIVKFDWSGSFYGAGITLKNPYGAQ